MKDLEEIYEEQLTSYRKDYKKFIINEMSLRLDDNQDILNKNSGFLLQGEYYIENGEFIETVDINNNPFDIYAIGDSICFVNSQKWAVAILEFTDNIDGIIMKYINSHRSYRNLMEYIFVEYLLPKYGSIISDNVQTESGFMFYKRLCSLQKTYNYKFFILNGEEERKIENCKEMDSTFGYSKEMLGFRYKLSLNI
jgi:hypothetical protein